MRGRSGCPGFGWVRAAVGMGILACGCGGAAPPPAAAPPAPPDPPVSAAPAPASAPATPPLASAPPPASAAADPPLDDPNEKPGAIAMTPEFNKAKAKASFPKKQKSDAQCWSSVSPSGDHAKDFDAIVSACGGPTGLVEYVKPAEGKLHHLHDPEDVFSMPVIAGYCYRYFAVADATITDLDLLIEKPGGALVGDDKTNSPYAIIDTDQPWCQDEDQTLEFHVKVDGPGKGGYMFGVWARPKH